MINNDDLEKFADEMFKGTGGNKHVFKQFENKIFDWYENKLITTNCAAGLIKILLLSHSCSGLMLSKDDALSKILLGSNRYEEHTNYYIFFGTAKCGVQTLSNYLS